MTIGQRHLRQATTVVGFLYFSGAVLVTVAWFLGWWPDPRSVPLVAAGVALAYVVGATAMVVGRRTWLPLSAIEVLTALGAVTATVVVIGGGAAASGAVGGFYGYVAAVAFFYFPRSHAIAQLALCGVAYAVALAVLDVDGAAAQWVIVIGIAGLGAGLVGSLGQRVRDGLVAEQAAAERLRELDRMREAFLRAVSHELRTPLAAVMGFAYVIERHHRELPDEELDLLASRLVAGGERLERLLVDLLDVDRLNRGHIEPQRAPTRLDVLVRTELDGFDTDGRTLHLDLVPVTVAVEAMQIERVVANLVGNAVKHTPRGSTIEVEVRPDGAGGAILVVEDDGLGIADELKAKVVEPFVQGRASDAMASPGTGIGLALVDRLVGLHGGTLEIADAARGGARMVVRLPGVAGRSDEQARAPVSTVSRSRQD